MHSCTRKQQRRRTLALAVCLADTSPNHPAPTRMGLAAETARLATDLAAAPLLRAASTPVSRTPVALPRRS